MTSTDNPTTTTAPVLTVHWDTVVNAKRIGYNGDTDEVEYTDVTLGSMVVENISRTLIDEIRKDIRKAVRDLVAPAIQAEVGSIVREQLNGTVRKTNRYGEPEGEPQTLRSMLGEEVQAYISEKPRDNRNGYSDYGARPGGFRELLQREVDAALTKDLKGVIVEARKQVVGKVQSKAAALIAEAIK